MSSSAADTATGLGIDLDDLKFWQSISSSAKLSAITVSTNVKVDDIKGHQLYDSYELWP
jgi:hypothetical protein